jgi:hypothetical protein
MAETVYPCTKKGFLVMKRGNEVAKISMVETEQGFAMNEVCQKNSYHSAELFKQRQ